MTFEVFLQYLFSGLTYGSIYAVVAIGFNIIYNSTGIINFAQGEFVMLGGMLTYTFSQFMPLPAAITLAVIATAGVGSIIELLFIRSLIKINLLQLNIYAAGVVLLVMMLLSHTPLFAGLAESPLLFWIVCTSFVGIILGALNLLWAFSKGFQRKICKIKKPNVLQMVVMTIGLSIIIREIALQIWGEQVKTVHYFTGNEVSSVNFLGAHFSPQILWVFGAAALIVIGLTLFFKFTIIGQAMRGCSANRDGASLCGINPQSMVNLSFALSAGIGALAGGVVAPITQTHYAVGAELAIKGFTVAVFGGLGNSVSAVIAGLLLGLIESYSIIVVPEAYKDIVSIGILLLVLFLRPGGLFGSKEASALKDF